MHKHSMRARPLLAVQVRARFKAECSAAAALEKEARAAALAGTVLPHDLHLVDDGTVAVVDEGALVVPPHPGFPVPQVGVWVCGCVDMPIMRCARVCL